MTLADEDTNPILTDNANRTLQGNLATRVTQPGGQLQVTLPMAKFCGAIWWPNLQPIQVVAQRTQAIESKTWVI